MNKKIFTLLASSLMLFLTASVMNAQGVFGFYGPNVQYLPKGKGKGAYHLKVTHLGRNNPVTAGSATDYLLSMDSIGFLKLINETDFNDVTRQHPYRSLREALWCVTVIPERYGKRPAYNFVNKQYSALLAVDTGRWMKNPDVPGSGIMSTPTPGYLSIYGGLPFEDVTSSTPPAVGINAHSGWATWPQVASPARGVTVTDVQVGGQYADWAFSYQYNTSPMETAVPLFLHIDGEPDFVLTFATHKNPGWGFPASDPPTIELVKVHRDDLERGHFYQYALVFFTLVEAAPRVLTEDDFNTTLWTNPNGTSSKLFFDPDVKSNGDAAITNVFTKQLTARAATKDTTYLNFRTGAEGTNTWIYVADGDTLANYYNEKNSLFPIIRDNGGNYKGGTIQKPDHQPRTSSLGASGARDGQFDFRLVYYPSQDSLMINVRELDHIDPSLGYAIDAGPPFSYPLGDNLFNRPIWDYLTIRMQDLTSSGKRVLTVSTEPAYTRIHFGVKDCEYTDDRTTVPANLYVIRDKDGRYLAMPLEQGDLAIKWVTIKENEDVLKTPSYQWLVYPSNPNDSTSAVMMVNREFEYVQVEFAVIYKTEHVLKGNWRFYTSNASLDDEGIIYYDKKANNGWYGSFKIVEDDPVVAAKVKAKQPLTEVERQKLYRTSPYIGYKFIHEDTLGYYTYSFNYLMGYNPTDYYLGIKKNQAQNDTTLYVEKGRNSFRLHLPDKLTTSYAKSQIDPDAIEGIPEIYGIGWGDSLLTFESTKDIAKLVRQYYQFQQNDYWNFRFDNNFLVLDDNGRYAFTEETWAAKRELKKSNFYLRFTYQPQGKPEYYTLLDRIADTDIEWLRKELGFQIMERLSTYDNSHYFSPVASSSNKYTRDSFAVLAMSIDYYNLFARAQVKTVGSNPVSTFSISNESEPLYRRFNEGVYSYYGMNDSKADDGGTKASDNPRLIKIYRSNNEKGEDYLYEDAMSVNAYGKGINFLSLESLSSHNVKMNDGLAKHWPHNFAFYLDTAYVNRGTGHIKPQYLIGVGPEFGTKEGCWVCGNEIKIKPWVYARFLINATDSARSSDRFYKDTVDAKGNPYRILTNDRTSVGNPDYIWDGVWDRLAFVPAIHIGDSLYLVDGVDWKALFIQTDDLGEEYLHLGKLIEAGIDSKSRVRIIPLDDNYHKDVVFSMRFFEKGNYQDFLLESEPANRDFRNKYSMIAPMVGGWVKWHNGEMVISRGSYKDAIRDAEWWNTEATTDDPVANENIGAASAVKVIAGEGNVSILNAAGKQVTISNVLGQTVASAVLTSDNATINVPKGILVVAVEGESAVKAVVK